MVMWHHIPCQVHILDMVLKHVIKICKLGIIKRILIFDYVNRLNLFYTVCTIHRF
jgi:hypothetical protein